MESPSEAKFVFKIITFSSSVIVATLTLSFLISSSNMIPQTRLIDVNQVNSKPLFVSDLASFCSKGAQAMDGFCSFSLVIPSQKNAPDFRFFAYDVLKVNQLDVVTKPTGGAMLLIRSKGSLDEMLEISDFRTVDIERDRQINIIFAQGNITFQFDKETTTMPNQVTPAFDYLRVTGLPQELPDSSRVTFKMNATINEVNRPVSIILQLLLAFLFFGSCITIMSCYINFRHIYLDRNRNE